MQLPPGEYYFLARGKDLFAFYGRNPVQVPPQGLEALNLGMVAARPNSVLPRPPLTSGIYGTLLHEGQPVAGALVYLYTDLTSGLKGMGYALAGPTDETGYFETEVPPGTYYVLTRKRLSGDRTGPLQSGDFTGYHPANPLRIKADQVLDVSFEVLEVPDKVKTLEGSLFGQTAIRGRILTVEGQPVPGARAVLYEDPSMFNRPLYVSQPTDADGVYVLTFPQGATYYLAARNTLGGAPSPGDLYGTYDATVDHAIVIETGQQLQDIDIHVEEMW